MAETPEGAIDGAIEAAAPVARPAAPDNGAGDVSAPGRPSGPIDPGRGGEADDYRLAWLPLTDLGNAERFRARYGEDFIWCEALGWLAWDGRRYARDGARARLQRAVYDTVRRIKDEAKAIAESDDDFAVKPAGKGKGAVMWSDKIAAWARASESAARLQCVPNLAACWMTVDGPEDLDADPWLINVLNGTLEVRRRPDGDYVRLRPHDRADRLTKLAPVAYDPDAVCPTYDEAMAYYQPDERVRAFLHRWGGLSLTGDVSEQKFCFWYGLGGNGKGTTIETWAHVAGDYAGVIQVESLLDQGRHRRGGDATPDLAQLPGVRLLRVAEPSRGSKLDTGLVKTLTGGDPVAARHLNSPFFEFFPQFSITMSGNHKPIIRDADEGIWRRVILVPWDQTVPDAIKSEDFQRRLRTEAAGVLNRLLDGLRAYLDVGLGVPETVVEATAEYRQSSDPLGPFLDECCSREPGQRASSKALYDLFIAWARENGSEERWTHKGFSAAMQDRGWRVVRSNGSWFEGLRIVRSAWEFGDPAP